MKNLIFLSKAFVTMLTLLSGGLSAFAHDFYVNGIYYNYLDETAKTVEVTYKGYFYDSYSNEYTGSVTIPSSVTYNSTTYSVTSIGNCAFENCTGLTSVTIGNSVTKIGDYAFYNCSGLTSVTIGNSVTEIGYEAFYNCSGLTEVTIPNSVTEIGEKAFDDCSYLTSVNISDLSAWCSINFADVSANPLYYAHKLYLNGSEIKDLVIPNDVTEIKNYAFWDCEGLTSVTIGNSVTSIGHSAFCNCKGLTEVTIPNSVTSIGPSAFNGCSGLTEVTIPNSVTEIEGYAFNGCSGLTGTLTIPNSVTSIGGRAFKECSGLTGVTIPNSVSSIGNYAFYGCTSVTSVTIGNSVTEIGDGVFQNCSGLTEVNYNAENCTSMGSSLYPVFSGCTKLKTINIGNNVKTIPSYAFKGCTGLTSITIPNSVTKIGEDAFYGCSSLTSVVIGNSVTEIGEKAFLGCKNLKVVINLSNLTFTKDSSNYGYIAYYANQVINDPNASIVEDFVFYKRYDKNILVAYLGNATELTLPMDFKGENYTIDNYAFYNRTELTSVTIPNSVTWIGNYAFYGCTGLTEITVDSSNTKYDSRDNCNAIIETTTNTLIYGCKSSNIPNSVTKIGWSAFEGCIGLTSITIPNSVTWIGSSAFEGCTSLAELIFEDGKETLSLEYNKYNSSGTGEGLFYDCPLEKLYLGRNLSYESMYSYGYSPFYDKTKLKEVTIGNSVTEIGEKAFDHCSSLTSVNISDLSAWCKIIFYDSSSNPLYFATKFKLNGTEITNLVIPNDVTEIKAYAFYSCDGLTSISIPYSVTEIGSSAFSNCSGLTNITVDSGNTKYDSRNNCNAIIETATNTLLYGCKSSNIPNSVTSIDYGAFKGCTGLTSITIPNSVTEIGEDAFYGCNNLKVVINLSNLTFSKGSSSYGYVAYYANDVINVINVINDSNGSIIDDFAFYRADNVNRLIAYFGNETKLILPTDFNGENYVIDNYAFYGCTSLTSLTIGNSVTEIGDYAFYGCTSVTSVTIGNSVTEIGDYAFYGCTGLTEITVDSDNAKYDSRDNCNAIIETTTNTLIYGCKSSNIPNSVTSIGASAFYDCTGLTSVSIGNSITSIGESAFSGCSMLTSITIPNSVTEIGDRAFNGCKGLTKLTIEDGTETLSLGYNVHDEYDGDGYNTSEGLFYDCPLDTLYLGRNLSYNTRYDYGYSPFYKITTLKSITIGNSVTTIESNAFGNTAWYNNQPDGVIYAGRVLYKYKGTMPNNTSIDIKEETVSISPWAFSGCSRLTEVTIPNSVTEIGDGAFSGCSRLTEVTIPNSVTEIGDGAFSGCSRLTKLTIEYGTETLSLGYNESNSSGIGKGLFYGCPLKSLYLGRNLSYNTSIEYGYSPFYKNTELETITIGNSVTEIKGLAFLGCTGLKKLTFEDGTKTLLLGNNSQYNDSKTNQGLFNDCSLDSLYIGRNIDYSSRTDDYTHSFSPFAFQSRLKSVTIGNTVSYIVSELFYYCKKLYNVIIGNSVNRIGSRAFAYCRNLREIIIPNSVTEFGNNAFRYCSGLTRVWFNAENCSSMRDLNVFAECPNLYDISFGDNVRNIPDYAFMDCNSLSKIAIGKSVTNIGYKAFFDCGLSEITSYCMTPPTCSISFSGGTHSALESRKDSYSASLYVPEGTKDAYANAYEWKNFYNIQEIAGVEDVLIDNVIVKIAIENGNISINGIDSPHIEIYNINGKCIYSGNDTTIPVSDTGVYILRINGKSYKIVNK